MKPQPVATLDIQSLRCDKIILASIVLACVGPGIYAYGIYPYHLILPFASWCIWTQRDGWPLFFQSNINRSLVAFAVFNVAFDLVSTAWSQFPIASLRYSIIETLGFATVGLIVWFVGNNERKFERALRALLIVTAMSLCIGLVEITTPVRWPFSKLSSFAAYVGVNASAFDLKQLALYPEVLRTTPTGLNWNPNDFALMIGLAFAFVVDRVRGFWFAVVQLAVLTAIAFASARLTFYAVAVVSFANILLHRQLRWIWTFVGVVFFVGLSMIKLPKAARQLNELTPWGYDYKDVVPVSISYRKTLFDYALRLFSDNPVIGIGPGNFQPSADAAFNQILPISDLHFYWLQYAIEKGLVGVLVALIFIAVLAKRFVTAYKIGTEKQRHVIRQFAASGFLLAIGGISLSSMVYFLPMYIWLGLAISFINTCDNGDKNSVAGRR